MTLALIINPNPDPEPDFNPNSSPNPNPDPNPNHTPNRNRNRNLNRNPNPNFVTLTLSLTHTLTEPKRPTDDDIAPARVKHVGADALRLAQEHPRMRHVALEIGFECPPLVAVGPRHVRRSSNILQQSHAIVRVTGNALGIASMRHVQGSSNILQRHSMLAFTNSYSLSHSIRWASHSRCHVRGSGNILQQSHILQHHVIVTATTVTVSVTQQCPCMLQCQLRSNVRA